MKNVFLLSFMMSIAINGFAQSAETSSSPKLEVVPSTEKIDQATLPLHIFLYAVKDYAALQDAQKKLEELTKNSVVVTRSNEELVELQSSWDGNENLVEQAKQALNNQFRLDTSYQADQAMTLLFRYREQY